MMDKCSECVHRYIDQVNYKCRLDECKFEEKKVKIIFPWTDSGELKI